MEPLRDAKISKRGQNRQKKTKPDESHSKIADVDSTDMPVNQLGEDELTLIFSLNSYWISTHDLLNFRLVNKSWRDAASTTLLRRDACYFAVKVQALPVQENEDDAGSHRGASFFYKHEDQKVTLNTLTQLTELISNSPKFPSLSFRIHTSLSCITDYAVFADLVLFFKLHGKKIKILSPVGCISQDLLLDICNIYAPKLECLDLSGAQTRSVILRNEGDEGEACFSKRTFMYVQFKTLILGGPTETDHSSVKLLHDLLSSPSKLNHIKVTLSKLAQVLKDGKGHLVTSLNFWDTKGLPVESPVQLVDKYLELNPKLSELSLDLANFYGNESDLTSVNSLIKSSGKTLRNLKLYYSVSTVFIDYDYDDVVEEKESLKLPALKNLKSLTLKGKNEYYDDGEIGRRWSDFEPDLRFEFKRILSRKQFPSLLKVRMEPQGVPAESSLDAFLGKIPRRTFPTVDILEIHTSDWNDLPELPTLFKHNFLSFAKVFPNIRILKFNCGKIRYLNNSLWTLESLEFIEIYQIRRNEKTYQVDPALVDQFFTGFSLKMCELLQAKNPPRSIDMNNPETLKFLQLKTPISNIPNLKELKLQFSSNFNAQFATRVTGLYLFSKMPTTKCIISYDPEMITSGRGEQDEIDDDGVSNEDDMANNDDFDDGWEYWHRQNYRDAERNAWVQKKYDDEKDKYENECFGPIKPYIQIVRERQNY